MISILAFIAAITGSISILLCIEIRPTSDRQRRNEMSVAKVLAVICGTATGIAISMAVMP